jgi:hypothetical protein
MGASFCPSSYPCWLSLVGLHKLASEHATPLQVIEEDHPGKVRVVRTDWVRLVLSRPYISGDSLFGTRQKEVVGVPLSEVTSVEPRKFDVAKSIGVGYLVPAVALGVAYIAACGDDTDYC